MQQLENVTQADPEKFKQLFPEDKKLQSVTLDDVHQYARNIEARSLKPGTGDEEAELAKAEVTLPFGITPCEYATAIVGVDVFFCSLVQSEYQGIDYQQWLFELV